MWHVKIVNMQGCIIVSQPWGPIMNLWTQPSTYVWGLCFKLQGGGGLYCEEHILTPLSLYHRSRAGGQLPQVEILYTSSIFFKILYRCSEQSHSWMSPCCFPAVKSSTTTISEAKKESKRLMLHLIWQMTCTHNLSVCVCLAEWWQKH